MIRKEAERELPYINHNRGLITLSPLLVFFLIYVVSSLVAGDFYKMPVAIAFLAASGWAFMVCKPKRFAQRVERFSIGAAHSNIMMMIWIFILAGAFAKGAEHIGAVNAMVNLTLNTLPANMLLPGVFLAACLISLSIGTSVGTIAALMPVAAGLATSSGVHGGMMAGAVVGGAFFGDNLSFISDTTIAATRTQGCAMKDKFRANFRIVIPAAIGILILYTVVGLQYETTAPQQQTNYALVLPYI
ncbi:MAG: Na+/H+ antiporter NhaC family protein, partial [Akkermansia sp.]|nr:Na+/H+ antiporter NhaC family protein [Akkermansia sp.]